MVEVAQISYCCQWDGLDHVMAWPMRITFGAVGPEVTVDQILEGRGHAVMLIDHLAELVDSMTPKERPIQLGEGRPAGLARKLTDRGFYVELLQVP